MALALTIVVFAASYNIAPQRNSLNSLEAQMGLQSGSIHRSASPLTAESLERIRIMDANIRGTLRNGTFETVVPFIESLTIEKGGFLVTEHMAFEDLWSGEIVSKLPPVNARAFAIEARKKISENGRVAFININIREFTTNQNTTNSEYYSTIKTFLREEFEEGKETPEPIIQLMYVFPILVTGLVWVAGGLIVGVPLCFISLGIVMLVKRVIIPLWKKELGKPV